MNVETIEFEALTREAIVFVADLPFREGNYTPEKSFDSSQQSIQ
jgi:hypothetical protein